jgi:predicted RND superfamily exporter protein
MKAWRAGVAQFNADHRAGLIVGFSIFIIASAIGASRVVVDSNSLNDFWKDSPIRQATVRVDDEMGGVTNIVYLFDGGGADAIKDPAVLREIERLESLATEERWLVRKAYSIVDIVKDLNQAFHGGDPAFLRIPDSHEAVAQLLLLYEASGGDDAEEYVSSDYRHANLELRLRLAPTAETARLIARLDARLAARPLEHSSLSLTGIGALWLKLLDFIVSSQIQGFSIAFTAITLMMIGVFRSFKVGLISMIPNLAPVFLALGAMGWSGIPLDYNKVMVAAIALGISVDDTIHLMTRFRHEFGVHKNYERALRAALEDVDRALLITSLALVLGFLVLVFSELRSQAFYGLLLSGALVTALIADLFFMPALVLWLQPFGPEGEGLNQREAAQVRAAA